MREKVSVALLARRARKDSYVLVPEHDLGMKKSSDATKRFPFALSLPTRKIRSNRSRDESDLLPREKCFGIS